MGFKTQKGFLFTGSGDGLKYVSGKRQSWYISEQGNPGVVAVVSIVSTNLKLHLDAGDSDSYIGSGATWIDLITGNTARSVDFDGTDDVLTTATSSDFDFGSGDFTVEAWCNTASIGNTGVVSIWNYNDGKRSWSISGSSGNTVRGMVSPDGAFATRTEITGTLSANEWNHIAFTRSSNTLYLFINGIEQGTASFTGSVYNNTSDGIMVGGQGAADDINNVFSGKISNVRIVKGTAVYTSAFSAPTQELTNITNTKLLCCNKSSTTGSTVTPGTITANSSPTVSISNPFPFGTKRSIEFDGTDDYLSVASSSDLTFGTGDFTVEFWAKPDDFGSRGTFYDSRPSNGTSGITIGHESSSGEIRVYMSATSGSDIVVQSSDFETGQWQHIAVTRSSGTVTLFINGVSKDTGTRTTDLNNTNAVNIGYKSYTSSSYSSFDGNISNIRITKGQALYTSNFTVPTQALTTTSQGATASNVKLLCCNNYSVKGATVSSGTITTSGDPTASTINPFATKRSVDFDGTDDKLSIPDSTDFEFGSGDFTIEAWVKQENAAGSANTEDHSIVNKWDNTSSAKEWAFRIQGNYLQWLQTTNGSSNQITTGNTVISAGQWYHLAVVGHSGTIKLFVNGTQQSSTGTQGTIHAHSNPLYFGYNESTNSSWMDGLMSNCRIIKGTALYTSSFNPPTEPLTSITNTKFLGLNNLNVTGYTVSPGDITASSSPTASTINPFDTNGIISGATYSSSDGGILDFDGTDDYAVTEGSSDFNFGSGDFTVEVWCKPTNSTQTDPAIIALWNYPDGRRSWTIFGDTGGSAGTFDGSIRAAVSPDGAFATRTEITGSLTLNTWNHVVFTRISNTLTFYINNSSAGTASFTGSVYSNTVDGITIGAMGDSAAAVNEFDGGISQVRIYKGTGLTSTQVTQNYNVTKSTFGL